MMKQRIGKITAAAMAVMLLLSGCSGTNVPVGTDDKVREEEEMQRSLEDTNPEFVQIMEQFIKEDVSGRSVLLDSQQKQLIALVSLVSQQSEYMLKEQVEEALAEGVDVIQIREAVYQCAPYVGMARVADAIGIMNGVFEEQGISLPLENQGTVEAGARFEKGLDAQARIFGNGMRQIAAAPDSMSRSSYDLVINCFGDYYTRDGLDLETREMLTLAMLVNLGTESQINSHIAGNSNMGRDKEFISEIIYQCLPYAGYPRILNALNCLEAVIPDETP